MRHLGGTWFQFSLHMIWGVGTPTALQVMVNVWPDARVIMLGGPWAITGAAAIYDHRKKSTNMLVVSIRNYRYYAVNSYFAFSYHLQICLRTYLL